VIVSREDLRDLIYALTGICPCCDSIVCGCEFKNYREVAERTRQLLKEGED
jgi:hypothetical protein